MRFIPLAYRQQHLAAQLVNEVRERELDRPPEKSQQQRGREEDAGQVADDRVAERRGHVPPARRRQYDAHVDRRREARHDQQAVEQRPREEAGKELPEAPRQGEPDEEGPRPERGRLDRAVQLEVGRGVGELGELEAEAREEEDYGDSVLSDEELRSQHAAIFAQLGGLSLGRLRS